MAAIPYPTRETLSPETAELLVRLGSLNVTRMMAHSTRVLDGYSRLGLMLLRKGKLDPLLRELAILRVGCLNNSPYEWRQHVDLARALGADEAVLEAVKAGTTSELTQDQRLVVAYAEQLCLKGAADAPLLQQIKARFSPEQIIELTIVCGYYVMTAIFLNTLDIEIEDTPPLGMTISAQLNSAAGKRS